MNTCCVIIFPFDLSLFIIFFLYFPSRFLLTLYHFYSSHHHHHHRHHLMTKKRLKKKNNFFIFWFLLNTFICDTKKQESSITITIMAVQKKIYILVGMRMKKQSRKQKRKNILSGKEQAERWKCLNKYIMT